MPACAMCDLLLDAAAGSLDRGLGASGQCDALDDQLPRQLALLDDLRALGGGRNQLGSLEGREVDGVTLDHLELVQQHLGGVLRSHRPETDLRQTTLHRGLAAFEASLDLALAGTGEGALVATTGSLAQAGA